MHNVVDVRDAPYSAAGDGVRDDFDSFRRALEDVRAGGLVVVPPGRYRVSQSIQIHAGCAIEGTHQAENVCAIVGDNGLIGPVIDIVDGANVSVRNLTVLRATDDPDRGDIGVQVRGDYCLLENVLISHHGIACSIFGGLRKTPSREYLQTCGVKLNRVQCYNVKTAYCQVRDSVQVTFTSCDFGRTGGETVGPVDAYVRIEGKVDTLNFIRCQFNHVPVYPRPNKEGDVFRGLFFKDASGGQVLNLIGCHMELVGFPFWFENTQEWSRIYISNCTISGNEKRLLFVKNNADPTLPSTVLSQCSISCGHIDYVIRAEDGVKVDRDNGVWTYPERGPTEQRVRDIYLNLVRGFTPDDDLVDRYVPAASDEDALRSTIIRDNAEKIIRYAYWFFTGHSVNDRWLSGSIPYVNTNGVGKLHDSIVNDYHGTHVVEYLYQYIFDTAIDASNIQGYKDYLRAHGYVRLAEQFVDDYITGLYTSGLPVIPHSRRRSGDPPLWELPLAPLKLGLSTDADMSEGPDSRL
jgi:hypothetical protein